MAAEEALHPSRSRFRRTPCPRASELRCDLPQSVFKRLSPTGELVDRDGGRCRRHKWVSPFERLAGVEKPLHPIRQGVRQVFSRTSFRTRADCQGDGSDPCSWFPTGRCLRSWLPPFRSEDPQIVVPLRDRHIGEDTDCIAFRSQPQSQSALEPSDVAESRPRGATSLPGARSRHHSHALSTLRAMAEEATGRSS